MVTDTKTRGIRATRTHCPKGHEYGEYRHPLGHRRCLECDRASKRKYKQRIKAEKAVNQGGAR